MRILLHGLIRSLIVTETQTLSDNVTYVWKTQKDLRLLIPYVFMAYRYELTIDKILTASVRNNPDQIISYQGKENITYEKFNERVYNLASSLVKLGVERGDRVAVLDWDTNRYLEAYYAVPMSGAVLHTVNIRYPPELIYYTMQHAEDKYVIIRDEFVPLVAQNKALFSFVKKWIIYSESGNIPDTLEPTVNYDTLVLDNNRTKLPELTENTTATTFYTSGTTGLPKGVSFTHRQIVLHTLTATSSLSDPPINLSSRDVIMPLVPMFHVHSWGMPYTTIMKGMKYVLPGRYDIPTILSVMKKEKVTLSAMVPSILYMLITNPDASRILSDNHMKIIVGGGALLRGLAEKARALGIETIAGYGMSETAPILTLSTFTKKIMEMDDQTRTDYRIKTGVPISLVDLRVVDRDGKEVPRDSKSIGEIIVKAPWLTDEYVKDSDGTGKLWVNGWMHTGDLAVIDTYGYISIVDREKDAVKSGGEFIPTLILEDLISTAPGINEVAVVGKKDEKWGERPVAFVTVTPKFNVDDVKKHLDTYILAGRVAKFWLPDDYIVVKEFAKTSTGKIDKKPLREKL
jgi:fatty-acyl-CoA synthase